VSFANTGRAHRPIRWMYPQRLVRWILLTVFGLDVVLVVDVVDDDDVMMQNESEMKCTQQDRERGFE
jgi:hypothetical protein